MFSNKLIQVLHTFTRKEMTRFYELVQSPYFNKHRDVRLLIGHFNKIFPKLDEKNCERHTLFKQVFPHQPHDQKKLALIFTYAFRLVNQFLIQEQFKEKEGQQYLLLLEHLRKKNQLGAYEKWLYQLGDWLEQSPLKNSEHIHLQFQSAMEARNYYSQLSKHENDGSIQQKQDYLDAFYFSEKLKDACEMIMRSKILKAEYDTDLLREVVKTVEQNFKKYENIPSIVVYYQVYQMMLQGAPEFYKDLIPILEESEAYFPKRELTHIYNYLQHFCMVRINRGEAVYLKELFLLYQLQLKNGLLIENNYLSQWHYKNIVTTGLRLNENDWVIDFIETYRHRLAPEVEENAYTFNRAAYFHNTGQYEKVLDLLVKVEYNDIRYSINAKALLLRTYYDQDEYAAFLSLADSFRQFLLRNKQISDDRRKGYSNLLKFTKKAFQIKNHLQLSKPEKVQKELHKLLNDIQLADTIFNQSWLSIKVNELLSAIG